MTTQPFHRWQVGDQAMLAGEPVTVTGFIDHEGPGPLDEILVELANGEERTVRRDALTSLFDVISRGSSVLLRPLVRFLSALDSSVQVGGGEPGRQQRFDVAEGLGLG